MAAIGAFRCSSWFFYYRLGVTIVEHVRATFDVLHRVYIQLADVLLVQRQLAVEVFFLHKNLWNECLVAYFGKGFRRFPVQNT